MTVEEQQQVRKGAKGDLTSNRQEIGPMDRYVAVEAPSNRVREKGVKKKKDEAQGPIVSATNPDKRRTGGRGDDTYSCTERKHNLH